MVERLSRSAEGDDGAWENQYENYHVNSKLGMITGVTEFNGKSRENLAIYPIQTAPDGGVDFGDVNITIPRTYFDGILNEKGEVQK